MTAGKGFFILASSLMLSCVPYGLGKPQTQWVVPGWQLCT
jgi:hypothetical protein